MKQLALLAALLGIASVHAGTFFVPNTGINTISQYDENGVASSFTSAFVNGPNGVALDPDGNLFVSTNANTIELFSASGTSLGTFANSGLNNPDGLAFDSLGNLCAANNGCGTSSVIGRALGPSLGNVGVANPLADPMLELHNSDGAVVATKDDWPSTQGAAIQATGLGLVEVFNLE